MIDPQQLIERIERAFRGVELGGGISLNMTEYLDSYSGAPEYRDKAQLDERKDWSAIPDATLEEFTVVFSFTDCEGYRFYLPAYMIWTVANHAVNSSVVGDNTIYALNPSAYQFKDEPFTSFFSREQLECILLFLQFCIEHDGTCDGSVAEQNRDRIRAALRVG